MPTNPRGLTGRARAAQRRLDAQTLLMAVRLQLRKVLASKAHAGSPRCYLDLRELADELRAAVRDMDAVVAIVAVLPPPMVELDVPLALAHDLARDPGDTDPWPPRAA